MMAKPKFLKENKYYELGHQAEKVEINITRSMQYAVLKRRLASIRRDQLEVISDTQRA